MSSAEAYAAVLEWARRHNAAFAEVLEARPDYARAVLAIERDGAAKPRKDIAKWSEVEGEFEYMWRAPAEAACRAGEGEAEVAADFIAAYDPADGKDEWFAKVVAISARRFPGENVTRAMQILRRRITGRERSPDLWAIMRVLGQDEVRRRVAVRRQA